MQVRYEPYDRRFQSIWRIVRVIDGLKQFLWLDLP